MMYDSILTSLAVEESMCSAGSRIHTWVHSDAESGQSRVYGWTATKRCACTHSAGCVNYAVAGSPAVTSPESKHLAIVQGGRRTNLRCGRQR